MSDMLMRKEYADFHILHNHGVDLKNRRIYLSDEIDYEFANTIVCAIDFFNSEKHFPDVFQNDIEIIINSPGGDVDAMLQIYDSIIGSHAKVITIGSGVVSSAGTLIVVCGDKRIATSNCFVMVHHGGTSVSGNDDEVSSAVKAHKMLGELYWKLLARHSNVTDKKWLSMVRRKGEVWLDCDDLLKYEMIDEVKTPIRRVLEPITKKRRKAI